MPWHSSWTMGVWWLVENLPSFFLWMDASETYGAYLLGRSWLGQTSVAHNESIKVFTIALPFCPCCLSFFPIPLQLPGMTFPIKLFHAGPCLILYFTGWGCPQHQDKISHALRLFLETMDWRSYESESVVIAKLVTNSPHSCAGPFATWLCSTAL